MNPVNGLPLRPIPTRTMCPEQQLVIVCTSADDTQLETEARDGVRGTCQWVFGPGTHNTWPEGDYCIDGHYVELAWQPYSGIVRVQREHNALWGDAPFRYRLVDLDYQMDLGL